jgi:hypothetical protein
MQHCCRPSACVHIATLWTEIELFASTSDIDDHLLAILVLLLSDWQLRKAKARIHQSLDASLLLGPVAVLNRTNPGYQL